MEEGKGRRTGKRTRRTRQQILEAEAALTQPQPSTSSSIVGCNDGGSSLNQKKSLRIMFQDAKNGKLGRQSKSKLSKFVWPRTVESTKSPFDDPSGKNKLFYLISIGVYPVSKIIQPSDTESEEEESYEPVDVVNDNSPPREVSMPYFRNRSSGSNGPVYVDVDDNDEEESRMQDERSPSPASPKVRRGRRPTNARRVPYGRANDLDHSWRSNYNRRCAQRRIRQQGRQRIRDPQVIQDIINTVIERYQGHYLVDDISHYVTDNNNNVIRDEVAAVV